MWILLFSGADRLRLSRFLSPTTPVGTSGSTWRSTGPSEQQTPSSRPSEPSSSPTESSVPLLSSTTDCWTRSCRCVGEASVRRRWGVVLLRLWARQAAGWWGWGQETAVRGHLTVTTASGRFRGRQRQILTVDPGNTTSVLAVSFITWLWRTFYFEKPLDLTHSWRKSLIILMKPPR